MPSAAGPILGALIDPKVPPYDRADKRGPDAGLRLSRFPFPSGISLRARTGVRQALIRQWIANSDAAMLRAVGPDSPHQPAPTWISPARRGPGPGLTGRESQSTEPKW